MDARLNICIPTRNRYEYLRWTLDKVTTELPFASVHVSDNASTDATWLFGQDERIGYIRQIVDIGAFPNMYAALSMARGQYAVYCADDDYLLPRQVSDALAYLDAHPEVAAYCAPCEAWNEIGQFGYWNAWGIPEPRTYTRADGMALFNDIIENHIWPEHLIYRMPLPLKPRTRAYWAFSDIADILDAGAIHFSPKAYYRNIHDHPVGPREQLGNQQCLTHFDEYRAGLEVLAFDLFGHPLLHSARRRVQDMIAGFICTRMDIASKLYLRQGNEVDAIMLKKRIGIEDPRPDA